MNCNGMGSTKSLSTAQSIASFGRGGTKPVSISGSTPSACGRAAGVDEAGLSRAAGVLAKALAESDVRMEKVAALKRQIEAGTYSIPASDVAASIIRSMLS